LSWGESGSSYDIEYWNDSAATHTIIRGISDTSRIIGGLLEDTPYTFSVYAVDSEGRSSSASISEPVSLAVPEGEVPVDLVEQTVTDWRPSGITATADRLAVDLNWFALPTALGYELEYWTDSSSRTFVQNISGTSLTISRLTAGDNYYFRVYALTSSDRYVSQTIGPVVPIEAEPIPVQEWVTSTEALDQGLTFTSLRGFADSGMIYGLGQEGFFHVSPPVDGNFGVVTFISNIGPLVNELTYIPSPSFNNCLGGLTEIFDERALEIYVANDAPNTVLVIPEDTGGTEDAFRPPTLDASRDAAFLVSSIGNFGANSKIKPIPMLSRGAGEFLYTVDSGSLPNGLSLNATSGVVSGIPATPQNYEFTLTVARKTTSAGGVVTYTPEDTGYYSGIVFSLMVLDNVALRFGSGNQNSINAKGLFEQPFYRSINGVYFKLTYSSYPLDMAIGSGTGSNWTGSNVQDLSSLTPTSAQEIDYRNFTVRATAGSAPNLTARGYGVVEVSTQFTVNSQVMEVRHKYTLGVDTKFVKIETTIVNKATTTANNVNIWVGTRDDWVGGSDSPIKKRGNIDSVSGFVATSNTFRASALQITSAAEGALFYSTTPGTDMSVDGCCSFSNAYNRRPSDSRGNTPFDGSYAAVLPAGNIDAGGSTNITWFYAAGAIGDLNAVAQAVASAANPPAPPEMVRSSNTVTLRWQPPELQADQAITGYVYRYSTNGGATWTESATLPLEDVGTAPDHEYVVTGLNNAATYIFQIAAVTTTIAPGGPLTPGAWSQSSDSSVLGVPQPPSLISGRGGDEELVLDFLAPESDISPLTYLQYCFAGCEFSSNWDSFTRPSVLLGEAVSEPYVPASPATVTNVQNGESYSVRIRSVNEFGPSQASNSLTLVTNPAWTTQNLPRLDRNTPFSEQLVATSTILEYALVEGALPDGLSLASSGLLAGTPTLGGAYDFTISARNESTSTNQRFTGYVYPYWIPSETEFITTTGSVLDLTLDTSSQVSGLTDRTELAVVSEEGLPPGTTLEKTNDTTAGTMPTLKVLGTPTTTGTFRATITISRGGSSDARVEVPFIFNVTPAPPAPNAPQISRQSSEATIRWDVPEVDPSQSVTGYVYRYSTDAGNTWVTSTLIQNYSSPVTAVIPELTNVLGYIFQVATVSQVGEDTFNLSMGQWSGSSEWSILGAPEPPTITAARGGNESISLYYTQASSPISEVLWYEYCLRDCAQPGTNEYFESSDTSESSNWIAFTASVNRGTGTVVTRIIPPSPVSIRDLVENGQEYLLQIRAVNIHGPSSPAAVTPVVTKPVWTTTSFEEMVRLVPYPDQQLVAASSITSYRVTSGSLPGGIELSSSGLITGTPTTGGAYRVVITAENSGGSTDQVFEGFVLPYWIPEVAVISLSTRQILNQQFDTSSTVGMDVSNGATLSVRGLPPGVTLTVDRESTPGAYPTFSLFGQATAPGSYTVVVTIIDSIGQEVTSEILIIVRAPRSILLIAPTPEPMPSNPSRPSPIPTRSPGGVSIPDPSPETSDGIVPTLVTPIEPTPNVVYDDSNPVPQALLDLLANPLAYVASVLAGGPVLPDLATREFLAYENGEAVTITLEPTDSNSGYIMSGDGWQVLLEATDSTGSPLVVDESGNIILNSDRFLRFGGEGFAPGSVIRVWIFSEPTEITSLTADGSGSFAGTGLMPEQIAAGEHTVQLNGLTKDGQVRSVSLGVIIGQETAVVPAPVEPPSSMNLWIAFGVLILGALLFLLWRRRRSREEEAVSPEIRPGFDEPVYGTKVEGLAPASPFIPRPSSEQPTSPTQGRNDPFGYRPRQG
jgi:hypothetical protein